MVVRATLEDFPGWLSLARDVETFFGPMADNPGFCRALRQAIVDHNAYCVRDTVHGCGRIVRGAIVLDPAANEIRWFAVHRDSRGKGLGRALLRRAIETLRADMPILVTTFDDTVQGGAPARALYARFGFRFVQKSGVNPAGVPTALLQRSCPAV